MDTYGKICSIGRDVGRRAFASYYTCLFPINANATVSQASVRYRDVSAQGIERGNSLTQGALIIGWAADLVEKAGMWKRSGFHESSAFPSDCR
jgi:hypothetical protein